jgi:hypothetical protein
MSFEPLQQRSVGKNIALVLAGWILVASAIGLAGWFKTASAPLVAATVWTLTALILLACWKVSSLRHWAMKVDLRGLVLLHLTRFVAGSYFLFLCRRGELPSAFATPAGWGDIIVAALAILLLALPGVRNWKMLLFWNMIGFADILFVVMTALRLGLADWQSMRALRELPLSLLPMFLVPLIIASHVLIFIGALRLKRLPTS